MSHRRRHLYESDAVALLAAIGACRDACVEALRKAPPTDESTRRAKAMICPGCGERVLIDYDPILKRWNCNVCGWSWSWRRVRE